MVFRRYFLLFQARDAYLDIPPPRAIFRYLSVDVSLPYSFPFSLRLFLFFSVLDLHRRRHFVFFLSFCLIPAAFQHRGSSARTLSIPQEPLDCKFPRWKWRMRGKFPCRGNKWTWSRNWFSCPSGKDFSLRLPSHPIVCRVCRDSRQFERYLVHWLGMLQFNRVPIILIIRQQVPSNQIVIKNRKRKIH